MVSFNMKQDGGGPNPWIEFLKQYKGQGYSRDELQRMYRNAKELGQSKTKKGRNNRKEKKVSVPMPTKNCPPSQVLNPRTGRCIKRDGALAKRLGLTTNKEKAKPTKKKVEHPKLRKSPSVDFTITTNKNSMIGTKLDGWTIRRYIASGGMGDVYECQRMKNGKEQIGAMKIIRVRNKKTSSMANTLENERKILQVWFPNNSLFVNLYDSKNKKQVKPPRGYFFNVYELLGPSLDEELKREKKFTEQRLLEVAQFMIECFKTLHGKKWVYLDCKPENIVNKKALGGSLRLIDFGISSRIYSSGMENPPADGTPAYLSLGSHMKQPASYHDDLENLLYTLFELWYGELPWNNNNIESVIQMKQSQQIRENMIKHAPKWLQDYAKFVYSSDHTLRPKDIPYDSFFT